MIYLFGKGENVSVVYDERILTEEDKKIGVPIENLPEEKTPADHFAVLCLDENNKPYYQYKQIQKDTLEDLVRKQLLTKEQYKTLTGKDFTV